METGDTQPGIAGTATADKAHAASVHYSLQEWKAAQCPAHASVSIPGESDLDDDYAKLAQAQRLIIEFAGFMDGRGFSHARKLRQLDFKGELLAGGNVLPDQWQYLQRCGFDGLVDTLLADEAAQLPRFSDGYQADAQQPLPRFRR